MKVLHVITGLNVGGAERMLAKLVSACKKRGGRPHTIISLTSEGKIGRELKDAGFTVHSCGMSKNPIRTIRGLWRLFSLIRSEKPDIVQTWMYHADLIAGTVARMSGIQNVVWNIRNSDLNISQNGMLTVMVMRLCGLLSRIVPRVILTNAARSQDIHIAKGYQSSKFQVIANGFDTEAFRPDPAAKERVCKELNIPQSASLVGLIARFHPQKRHDLFVQAMERVSQQEPHAYFILAGSGTEAVGSAMADLLKDIPDPSKFKCLGRRSDLDQLVPALDLGVLCSSWGEGFPNVLGEMMASAVPCVVTDVGDAAVIAGDTGISVPKDDPHALSEGVLKLLNTPEEERALMGQAAREKILKLYSIENIATQYEELYGSLIGKADA